MASTKLLVLTQSFPRFSGDAPGKYLLFQCRILREHGVIPFVVAPHDRGALEREILDGVDVFRPRYAPREEDETIAYRGRMLEMVRTPAGMLKLKRMLSEMASAAEQVISREKIQVVSGHWVLPMGMVMKRLRRTHPLPMIMTSHGSDIALLKRWGGLPYRPLRSFCRGLFRWTTVSSFLRNRIVALDPVIEPLVQVLPLPHNTGIFRRTGDIREPDLIVSVTRYTRQKRIPQLFEAFAAVARARPDARLVIFAQEPPPSSVVDHLSRLGIRSRVSLRDVASQEELATHYNRAGVVVLNSVNEGFGLALSEAMLCGAAVVGTSSGGIPDIIEHEDTGLLVPPDQPDALAAAMLRLLDDVNLRDRLARRGFEKAARTYDPHVLAGRLAEIVKSAALSA